MIDLLNDGWTVGDWSAGIIPTAEREHGKAIQIRHGTMDALRKRGLVEFRLEREEGRFAGVWRAYLAREEAA